MVTRLNIGGPAIHVQLLSTALDSSRFSTCLVVGEPDAAEGDGRNAVSGSQVRLIRLKTLHRSIRPWSDLVSWLALLRIIWRERPQIIHTHMSKAGAVGRLAGIVYNACGPGRRPGHRAVLVHTFHGHVLTGYFSAARSRAFMTIERWLARWTDGLLAVSATVKEDLVMLRVAEPERVDVIPLGLPLEPFLAVDGYRGVWRAPEETQTLLIGWVGRLVPIKRPELLLEALARLHRRDPACSWKVVMAGDGERRTAIEQLIISWGLTARIRCVGWTTDMPSLYADADVVCLTSANEGTPVALIEALAAGKPVIAMGVGGVLDVLQVDRSIVDTLPGGACQQTASGWVVRSGDAEGLAQALRRCAEHPDLRQRLGTQGRASVRERYLSTRLLRDMEQLYERLLAGRS
ncbi:MAG: glycosyltransferase [Candidatus Omnitrophica bacterium]|nr:glycosyltransferase [Candidatus Omnitrophota bacterium]